MANYSDSKYDQSNDTIPDGEYRGQINSAEFTANKETKKGPADVFAIGLKIKSQPLVDRVVYMNKYSYENNEKSEQTMKIFFSQIAKLGVDVGKFRKANDMRGLMDSLKGKWVVFEAKTKGDYQNINIKSLFVGPQTATTPDGAKPSDGLDFTSDRTLPPDYSDYTAETPQQASVDEMPF